MSQKLKTNLIWIDLEMTGLDVDKDGIIEIATIVTDDQLNILAQGPSLVTHQPDDLLASMDDWCTKTHNASGLTQQVRESQISVAQAEQMTIDFLQDYCLPNASPICGNSVWQDRIFIRRYMPKLHNFIHYKIIDVSSVKEVVRRWYPNNPTTEFKKKDTHRALTDIGESIDELRYYHKTFFVK